MVVGLSVQSWPEDHIPLPHTDVEAGSAPAAEPGTPAVHGAASQGLLGRDLEAETSKANGFSGQTASSPSECLLGSDKDDAEVDAAERERIWRKLSWAIVLCCLFMGIEVVGGVFSNSLAILTDAAHLLSDVAGFSLSLFALWAGSWRPTRRHSYGYQRMEILGALASVLMTWTITGFIVLEAVNRLLYSSEEVNGRVMFLTAAFGVAVNVAMAVLLSEHHSHGLPGQACTHDHTNSALSVLPSSGNSMRNEYAVLGKAEEPTVEKDSFLEMGTVARPIAYSSSPDEGVAVVVHRHDGGRAEPAGDVSTEGQGGIPQHDCPAHSEGRHAHQHRHGDGLPTSEAPLGGLKIATSDGPAGQHLPHAHSLKQHQHPECEEEHAPAQHRSYAHPHVHAHTHSHSHEHAASHGHPHSCGHDESQEASPISKAPSGGVVGCHASSEADALTPLFSPLQLWSDAPALPAGKLDACAPAGDGLGCAHVHSYGDCGGGNGPGPIKRQNINLRGAFLHVVGDLVQSVGVMVAGAVIWARPDWRAVDLGCTFLFSTLVVGTTVKMVRDIVEILMEATPHDVDAAALEGALRKLDGVQGVHRLHVWALSVGKNAVTCHVVARQDADTRRVLREASKLCSSTFKIEHVTIQIES